MEVPGVTVHQSLLHHFPREISISDSFDMRNITQAEQEGNTHEIFEDYKIKYNDEFLEIENKPFVSGASGLIYKVVYKTVPILVIKVFMDIIRSAQTFTLSEKERKYIEEKDIRDKVILVDVLFDYSPDKQHADVELSITKGDVIVVIDMIDQGWWEGWIKGKPDNIGFFPATFTKEKKKKNAENEYEFAVITRLQQLQQRGQICNGNIIDAMPYKLNGIPVIIMPLYDGDLSGYIKIIHDLPDYVRTPQYYEDNLRILLHIAKLFQCLNLLGLFYTDIKDVNLLYKITPDNKLIVSLGDLGSICGPEIKEGKYRGYYATYPSILDLYNDICDENGVVYGLGILFLLLFNKHRFVHAKLWYKIIQQEINEEPEHLPVIERKKTEIKENIKDLPQDIQELIIALMLNTNAFSLNGAIKAIERRILRNRGGGGGKKRKRSLKRRKHTKKRKRNNIFKKKKYTKLNK
jgi:hypothetical protein